jgi:hypothetical protein
MEHKQVSIQVPSSSIYIGVSVYLLSSRDLRHVHQTRFNAADPRRSVLSDGHIIVVTDCFSNDLRILKGGIIDCIMRWVESYVWTRVCKEAA